MLPIRSPLCALALLLVYAPVISHPLAGQIDARALRQPDVSATQIVAVPYGEFGAISPDGK